jgi:hypothetical protein
MNTYKRLMVALLVISGAISLGITACQKFTRPEMVIIPDPLPPAYNPLKTYLQFENNVTDEGESKLKATAVKVRYAPGISGQAIKFDSAGYVLLKAIGDTVKYPNEFVGLGADTLRNLGSFTVAFWMNGPGPVTAGAQGLFSISHRTEFWGNLEMFLENYDNANNEAFLKVHMFNAGVASGNGEQWNELKIPILNKWSHIAVTYDAANSQFTIYADGQPTSINKKVLASGNYKKVRFNEFNGMVLGTYAFQTSPSLTTTANQSWARSFAGLMDQFRLYNKALTAAEVNDLFTSKK